MSDTDRVGVERGCRVLNVTTLAKMYDHETRWVRRNIIAPEGRKGVDCCEVGADYFTTEDLLATWVEENAQAFQTPPRSHKPR